MKKRIAVSTMITLFFLTLYSASYAEDTFYGGISAGRSDFGDPCGHFSGSCDDRGKGFKAHGGIQVTENFGAEIAYLDLGESGFGSQLRQSPIGAAAQLDGFSLVGIAAHPLSEKFDIFLKAGFFRWNLDIVGPVGRGVGSVNRHGTDETYGIGSRFKVTNRIGMRWELEWFKDVGDSVTGESDVALISAGGTILF